MDRTTLVSWKYAALKALTYWVFWALIFGALALLAIWCPRATLWFLRIPDFVTIGLTKLFWAAFAPEQAQAVASHIAKWLGPLASKVSSTATEYAPRAVILVRLAFNGTIMISFTAWLLRLPLVIYYFNPRFVAELVKK
ncbi:MAG TPA: hypothetical protein VG984_03415 [Candidatus Paceibacterota bacterium]|nr:hypothetical protein [Candidatus Paceibacterota bacterium]